MTAWGRRVVAAMQRAERSSREELARLIGVNPATFRAWFTQDAEPDPGVGVYVRLAAVLGCGMGEFMDPEIRKEYQALSETVAVTDETEPDNAATALALSKHHIGISKHYIGVAEQLMGGKGD